jgi:adhesin/invasin
MTFLWTAPVTPAVRTGEPAPVSPLSRATNAVTVTSSGRPAQVQFAGLTPGFVGLYQVNAVVPAGVTPSEVLPVVLTVAGQPSPPVTIAVQ